MSLLSDLKKDVKKLSADLKSNKEIDAEGKKKLQGFFDKVDDKLTDLAPRREELEDQIEGIKTLEQEIGEFNNKQDDLKTNGVGLRNAMAEVGKKSKDPKVAAYLKEVEKTAIKISGLTPLKKK